MKTLIILLLLFIVTPVFAEIQGNLEVGKDIDRPNAFVKLGLGYHFDIWVLENVVFGSWLTWFVLPDEGLLMKKILYDTYTIGYRIIYEDFYIEIEHYCTHPEELSYASESQSTILFGIKF